MANTFRLVIASVGETYYDGAAASATFPGSAGEFTTLSHHEPFVSTLKKGVVTVKLQGGEVKEIPIEDGIIECNGDKVSVLL